ncbi:MAG: M20/M25/M40 family metallo-hydrolase [Fimbriimonadaceae bacterium]|nr:M20/M25/M40 family metallo-hydrolase [Fimbriimonadaceae bacterium]
MTTGKNLRPWAAIAMAAVLSSAFAQGDPNTNRRIIDIGKNHNQVMATLRGLTAIGPRLTTSNTLDQSAQWSMAKFRSYGLTNVHLEEWGEWPVGFQRGRNSSARMVSPMIRDFEFTSPSWTPGTNGPHRGRAMFAPSSMEELNAIRSDLKGAWIVDPYPTTRGQDWTPIDTAMQAAGVAGRITRSNEELVITSGRWNIDPNNLPSVRRVIIRNSDMDVLVTSMLAGQRPMLEINLDQKFIKGPRKNANVIADIRGSEHPDEYVIVSGHLDSWDGPGSVGASDNGTGVSVALETARILKAAGAKPKRTIRFILWTGEEQGLHGSRQYVEMHRDELEKISCVFVDDGGSNYQGGMTLMAGMEPILRKAQEPMTGVFPDMPFDWRVVENMPRGGGSDHAPFNQAGVPGFFWFETGRQDYRFIHHTQHDHLQYVIPEYLVQSSTNSAVMSYNVACADALLPRVPPQAAGQGGRGARPAGNTGGMMEDDHDH